MELRIDYFNNGKMNKEIYLETEKIRNSIRTNENEIFYVRIKKVYLNNNKRDVAIKYLKNH